MTWIVLGAVAGVAAAAVADTLLSGSSGPSAPPPTHERAAGDGRALLRGALHGTLLFTTLGDCRVRALELASLGLQPAGPRVSCGLWASRAGDLAVVPVARVPGDRSSRVALLRLDARPSLGRVLGLARGEVAWSRDGERVGWCGTDGDSVVLVVTTGQRHTVPGCHPHFERGGSLLTRPDRPLTATLLRDGRPLLRRRDLARGFSAPRGTLVDVVGFAASDDGLVAVVVALFERGRVSRRVLELWRGRRIEASVPLPELGLPGGRGRFGERVEFSPDGDEVAVAFGGSGVRMVLVDVATRRIVLPPTSQHGFAWSPGGKWLALSTGEEVRILGSRRRGAAAYVLELSASTLAWR